MNNIYSVASYWTDSLILCFSSNWDGKRDPLWKKHRSLPWNGQRWFPRRLRIFYYLQWQFWDFESCCIFSRWGKYLGYRTSVSCRLRERYECLYFVWLTATSFLFNPGFQGRFLFNQNFQFEFVANSSSEWNKFLPKSFPSIQFFSWNFQNLNEWTNELSLSSMMWGVVTQSHEPVAHV